MALLEIKPVRIDACAARLMELGLLKTIDEDLTEALPVEKEEPLMPGRAAPPFRRVFCCVFHRQQRPRLDFMQFTTLHTRCV